MVEPVGDEVFVYLLLADGDREDDLLMSAPPNPDLTDGAEGTRLDLRMDRSAIHLFDAETGQALLHGLEEAPETAPAVEEARTD